jgi:hypothetical protein
MQALQAVEFETYYLLLEEEERRKVLRLICSAMLTARLDYLSLSLPTLMTALAEDIGDEGKVERDVIVCVLHSLGKDQGEIWTLDEQRLGIALLEMLLAENKVICIIYADIVVHVYI